MTSSELFLAISTPMIISKRCVYGIQAAIYVAAQPATNYIQIAQIASKLNISFHLLTKVLQRFTQAGLMSSYRGPHGGVLLAKKPSEITLYDLITVIDTTAIFTQCMLGLPGCGSADPCPAHESWVQVRNKFKSIATDTTLEKLAEKAESLNMRATTLEAMLAGVSHA